MKNQIDKSVRNYLAEIGRRGGKVSRRPLDSSTAQNMVRVREAKRAYKKYHAQCFWSFDPEYPITAADVKWVGEQLKKNGNRKLWKLGVKLCP